MDSEIAYMKWLRTSKRTIMTPIIRERTGGVLKNKNERKYKRAFHKILSGLQWFKNNEYEYE